MAPLSNVLKTTVYLFVVASCATLIGPLHSDAAAGTALYCNLATRLIRCRGACECSSSDRFTEQKTRF